MRCLRLRCDTPTIHPRLRYTARAVIHGTPACEYTTCENIAWFKQLTQFIESGTFQVYKEFLTIHPERDTMIAETQERCGEAQKLCFGLILLILS